MKLGTKTRIKLRRDTAANWAANNPIPADGEFCYETDTNKGKLGNGITHYNLRPYFANDFINISQLGIPGGVATLDGSGKVPSIQLPALAITDTFVVGSQATMLALAANTGDVAIRTDLNKSFILRGSDPTVLGDWSELLTPTDTVLSVNGQIGAVSLAVADLTDVAAPSPNIGDALTWDGSNWVNSPAGGGLDVASTPITNGTIGRIAFHGIGDVYQEEADLFWDEANNRLGIGTETPISTVEIFKAVNPFLNIHAGNNGDFGITFSKDGVYADPARIAYSGGGLFMNPAASSGVFRINPFGNFTGTTPTTGYQLEVLVNSDKLLNLKPSDATNANQLINSATLMFGSSYWDGAHERNDFRIFSHQINVSGLSYLKFFTELNGILDKDDLLLIGNNRTVGIGGTPNLSGALDIQSTTGALIVPRMTTAQRTAITATNGMIIYDIDLNKFQGYENGFWQNLI